MRRNRWIADGLVNATGTGATPGINFWRYRLETGAFAPGRTDADHLAIYQRLCEERSEGPEELEALPLEAVRRRLSKALDEGWVVIDSDPLQDETVFWERRSDRAATIEGLLTGNWVRFDLYGSWTGDDANLLIDVMHEFGTPLFDPQVGEHGTRFEAPSGP